MVSRRVSMLLFVTAGCWSSAVFAQSVQPEISFEASAEVTYDSNIARSSRERAAARGLSREDERFIPSVELQIVRPFGRSSASVVARGGYEFHRRNSRLDREWGDISGTANLDARFCAAELSASIAHRQSDLRDIVVVSSDAPEAQRNARTTQDYVAFLSCGRPLGLRPALEFGYSRGDNSNPFRQLTDFRRKRYLAGMSYSHPIVGEALLFVSRAETELPNQSFIARVDEYETEQLGVRFERRTGARLHLTAEIARTQIDIQGETPLEDAGITGNLSMTAIVGPRLQAVAQASRVLDSRADTDATYFKAETFELKLTSQVSERLRVESAGAFTNRRNVYVVQVGPGAIAEEDRFDVSAGLNYMVRRGMQLRLSAGYERRDATGRAFDYSNTYAAARVSAQF